MAREGSSLVAFALTRNPGAYALVIGAGISRSTGVPTARDIVELLTKEVAAAQGEAPGDAGRWYSERYGEPATYGNVLARLAPTTAERAAALRGFFEPTAEERAAGEKSPTRAHKAIARLCAKGLVRVIVTTNFDRLLEAAIEAEGIVPVVVRHADDIAGMLPLPHVKTLVIKVNGDYVDTRLRNTPAELAEYDPRMAELLGRIARDFGFIVTGWSATHDAALREAMGSGGTTPFSTFWTHIGKPSEEALALMAALRALPIEVESADAFFQEVLDSVDSIEKLVGGAPLTPALAAATAKRLIEAPLPHIRLHDIVAREARIVRQRVTSADFPIDGRFDPKEFLRRVGEFETSTSSVASLAAAIARWGPNEDLDALRSALQTLCDVPHTNGNSGYLAVGRYPALLVAYSAGVTSTGHRRWHVLDALFSTIVGDSETSRGRVPAIIELTPHRVFDGTDKVLADQHKTAASQRIENAVRPLILDYFPSDREFLEAFDLFELLLSASYADASATIYARPSPWAPPLAFAWRRMGFRSGGGWLDTLQKDIGDFDANSAVLRAGLFGGSPERAKTAFGAVKETRSKLSWL